MNESWYERLINPNGSVDESKLDEWYKFMVMTSPTAASCNCYCNSNTGKISVETKYKLMCVAMFLKDIK